MSTALVRYDEAPFQIIIKLMCCQRLKLPNRQVFHLLFKQFQGNCTIHRCHRLLAARCDGREAPATLRPTRRTAYEYSLAARRLKGYTNPLPPVRPDSDTLPPALG